MKTLSLKLDDSIFVETEKIVSEIEKIEKKIVELEKQIDLYATTERNYFEEVFGIATNKVIHIAKSKGEHR